MTFPPFDVIRLLLPIGPIPRVARRRAIRDCLGGLEPDPGISRSVDSAVRWLCKAQDRSSTQDGGVSRHFSLLDGWGPSYPETTGYIIPTLLEVAIRSDDQPLRSRAIRMLDWLVSIQNADGSFNGGTVRSNPQTPVLFNTGQILIGLATGLGEFGNDYESATNKAANWMLDVQDPDGCWRSFESPFAISGARTYDTHAAIGLFAAAEATGNKKFADAAVRNVEWAIGQQRPNGWFANCCVTNIDQPLTHTIGYTIRGILEAYRFTNDSRFLASAILALDKLCDCLRQDGHLPGRLDSDWNSAARWTCLTGNLQIAECWLIVYEKTGKHEFFDGARLVNSFSRRLVETTGDGDCCGAVQGAFPLHGDYNAYQYPNWATKFFIDSNLAEDRLSVDQD